MHGPEVDVPAELVAPVEADGFVRERAAQERGATVPFARLDPYSSGIGFGGWRGRERPFVWPPGYEPLPVVPAHTWLLTTGWKRHDLVGLRDVPGPAG